MIERILKYSVERRHWVVALTLVAALFGAWSLSQLPIDAVPDITNKQVQINVEHSAFSTTDIERLVTFPLETALAGIPGLEHTRSISRNGFCQVTAVFDDAVDIYFARQQINERLTAARESLPVGIKPKMGPITTGLGEVLMWAVEFEPQALGQAGGFVTPGGERLTNNVQRLAFLRTVQDWIIRPQIKTVPLVADVDAIGGYVKQYHVMPRLGQLSAHGLTLGDLVAALERNNLSLGAGYIERDGSASIVRASSRLGGSADIAGVVLKQSNGTPIRISDVADVAIGGEMRLGSASINGHETVIGTAMMLTGANSRAVAKAAAEQLTEVRRSLPPGVTVRSVLDRSGLVNATIDTVAHNLFYGAALVIAVLFALLGNLRAAFLTALAIPLSMLFAAAGMHRAGISGNLMSLGAIDFGIIIDGSVIIVENCLRRLAGRQRELGRLLTLGERLDVVRSASHEVRRPFVYGVGIITVVYLPILALTGIEGKLFHPMALTVIFALAGAFVLSLTFVPAMVALAIRGRVAESDNALMRTARQSYAPVLDFALCHKGIVLGSAAAMLLGAGVLFANLGQEFVPKLDEGDIAMHAMRIPGTGIEQSTQMQLEVERAVAKLDEVELVFSKTGTADLAADSMPPSVSDTFIIFKPRAEWPEPRLAKRAIESKVRAVVGKLVGNKYEFTQPIEMRFHELISGVRGDLAVKVFGENPVELRRAAEEIAAVMRGVPGAADVKVEQTTGMPELTVRPKLGTMARYGLDAAEVVESVNIAIGGRAAGQVFDGDRRFDIVVRLPEAKRRQASTLVELPILLPVDPSGDAAVPPILPLSELAEVVQTEGPFQVSRENSKRRVVAQCNVRDRDLAGFVGEVRERVNSDVKLPAGTWLDWGGQFENLTAARQRLAIVVPACFALIFLLLHATFGAVRPALLVFTAVPLALTGGVAALWLRGLPFSISAAVGFIALSGVAVLNGLVLVTFINQLREQGRPLEEAVREGALTRLRPVLMTALVASLGFLPMALATGTGAEVQRPLATVVIGGILTATALTLVVLPALCQRVLRKDL
jgi:cobalt-zinc-cadmium resistance protein CzcA